MQIYHLYAGSFSLSSSIDSCEPAVVDAASLLWTPKSDRLFLLEQNTLLVRPHMSQLISWGHADGSVCLHAINSTRSEKTLILGPSDILAVHYVNFFNK